MRVYLVYDQHESPPYGVFSGEEKASEYIARMVESLEKNLNIKYSKDNYWIDCQDLDPVFTHKPHY